MLLSCVVPLLIYIIEIDRRLWASSASDNGWSNPYCCVLSPTQIPCSWHQCLLNPERLALTPLHVFAIPLQGLWFNSGIISIHFKAWSIAGETKVGDKMAPPFYQQERECAWSWTRGSLFGMWEFKHRVPRWPNHITGAILHVKLSLSIWSTALQRRALAVPPIPVLIGVW